MSRRAKAERRIYAGAPPRGFLHALRRLAHSCLPHRFTDPNDAFETASLIGRNDAEENEKTRPGRDERIEVHCLWVADLYPPTRLKTLLSSLRRLGWDQDGNAEIFLSEPLSSWIDKSRRLPYGGGWVNLGRLVRVGQNVPGGGRKVDLPAGVDYATASLRSLSPSVTALIVQFVFTDETARTVDELLRKNLVSYVVPRGGRLELHEVYVRKREEIRDARAKIRARCVGWFKRQIPGVFASGLIADDEWPAVELLTLEKARPFEDPQVPRPNYLDVSGLQFNVYAWHMDDYPIRLGPLESLHNPGGRYWVAALRRPDLDKDRIEAYGGANRHGITNFFNYSMQELVLSLAAGTVLSGYGHKLSELRDKRSDRKRLRSILRQLEATEDLLSKFAIDVHVVTSEFQALVDEDRPLREIPHLVPIRPEVWRRKITLPEYLRMNIREGAVRIREIESSLRQLLVADTTIASTRANLRLQLVLLIVTVVTLVAALLQAWGTISNRNGRLNRETPQPVPSATTRAEGPPLVDTLDHGMAQLQRHGQIGPALLREWLEALKTDSRTRWRAALKAVALMIGVYFWWTGLSGREFLAKYGPPWLDFLSSGLFRTVLTIVGIFLTLLAIIVPLRSRRARASMALALPSEGEGTLPPPRALTRIQHGKEDGTRIDIEPGKVINRHDFTDGQWQQLLEAKAVDDPNAREGQGLVRRLLKAEALHLSGGVLSGLSKWEVMKNESSVKAAMLSRVLPAQDSLFVAIYHERTHSGVISAIEKIRDVLGVRDPQLDRIYENPRTVAQIREVAQRLQNLAYEIPEDPPS